MGKISNSINHYLSDNRRFADFFNGICFQGEAVVRAEDLSEGAQVYYGAVQEPEKTRKTKGRKERTRDICKQLKTGGTLRILAVENQEMVDYTMPYRCMEYDAMEYGRQIEILRKRNRQGSHPDNIDEKISGIKKEVFQGLSHAVVLSE